MGLLKSLRLAFFFFDGFYFYLKKKTKNFLGPCISFSYDDCYKDDCMDKCDYGMRLNMRVKLIFYPWDLPTIYVYRCTAFEKKRKYVS
jgi:hypothetical protein